MWLSTEDAAKRLSKSVETIRRWARKGKLPTRLEPNPKGQPMRMVEISAVSAVIQCGHFQEEEQKKFTSVRSVRSKINSSAVSAVTENKSSAVISKEEKSSAVSAVTFDPKNKDLCNQCRSSHPSCDGCCNICEDKCNNEQECRSILTGQENKPELNHKGADSSPVPAPTSELCLQKQQRDILFQPDYNPRPEPEVPDSYKRIGQLRAQLCKYAIDLAVKASISKTEAYKRTVELYNFGDIVTELRKYKADENVSLRTLQRWIGKYKKGGNDYLDLVPSYSVGPGAVTITETEENYLLKYYLKQGKVYIGTIINTLKTKAMSGDMVSPSSPATLRRWMQRYEKDNKRVVDLLRNGETHLRNNLIKYIERDPSLLMPGDVFIADGNTLNFRILDPQTGKPKRMIFVAVMDWASRMIVGGSIATTEDTQNIANAYRNAFINYGGVPRVVYIDNGKAFKSRYFTGSKSSNYPDLEDLLGGMFQRLGTKEIFARAYNARAKIIERWFKTFNNAFERFLDGYVGASISDKPAHMHRNEPFMKKLINDRPLTYTEAQSLISYYINNFYHKQAHKGLNGNTPEEIYLAHPCPKERRISPSELDFLMLKHDLKLVNRNGITFLKQNYWHPNLADHIREKMYFRYDPNNISFIQVYNIHGKFICTARPNEKVHPMITLSENKEQTEKQVKKGIAYQNRIVRETKEQALKTLSNIQKDDHKFIESNCEGTNLFNNVKPEIPAKSKTMDEIMIEQTLKVKTHDDVSQPKPKVKKVRKLDTDIKTLGLG
ncbi:MAG: transposase [Candidatus Cloacimonetes bacterium]|nr:transposase [Candidatus Cloacimonadota bacterium]